MASQSQFIHTEIGEQVHRLHAINRGELLREGRSAGCSAAKLAKPKASSWAPNGDAFLYENPPKPLWDLLLEPFRRPTSRLVSLHPKFRLGTLIKE